MTLKDQLIKDEGLRLKPYKDSVGILTIGVGRNLEEGISEDEAMYLLDNDIKKAHEELLRAFPWVSDLDQVRGEALVNMAFNLGIGRLRGFQKMLEALQKGDWAEAANQALNSKWAVQVGSRAQRIASQFLNG